MNNLKTFLVGLVMLCMSIGLTAQKYYVQAACHVAPVTSSHFPSYSNLKLVSKIDQYNFIRYGYEGIEHMEDAESLQQELIRKGFVYAQIFELNDIKQQQPDLIAWTSQDSIYLHQSLDFLSIKTFNFSENKYQLDNYKKRKLDNLHQLLLLYPNWNLQIIGHSDERGSALYNLNLSKDRVRSVRNYLLNKGMESQRLKTKVYGESAPIIKINSPEDRQFEYYNRRVDIALINTNGEVISLETEPEPASHLDSELPHSGSYE